MTQDDPGYELKSPPAGSPPRPGEPGWVPPTPVIEKPDPPAVDYESADPDIDKNKGMAILAYVCFIIPLIVAPTSRFARFHANQGLLLFILGCVAVFGNVALWVMGNLISRFLINISILHFFLPCFVTLTEIGLFLAVIALFLYGVIQAANGEIKALPVIGQITLIK